MNIDLFNRKRQVREEAHNTALREILHVLTSQVFQIHGKVITMDARIQALVDAVAAERTVVASAVVLMNGITDRVTDAVKAALAANPGVDLSPITDLVSAIKEDTASLTNAVAADSVQSADPTIPTPGTPTAVNPGSDVPVIATDSSQSPAGSPAATDNPPAGI